MAVPALEYALNLLAARSYSSRNLKRKLARREYPPAEIAAAMERLTANGLLDDQSYAEQFVRGRLLGPGSSKRMLKQQLFARGIAPDVADAAIQRVLEDEPVDLDAMAAKAARKKIASMGDLEPQVMRRRLYAHLARAGYSPDQIRNAMERAFETG